MTSRDLSLKMTFSMDDFIQRMWERDSNLIPLAWIMHFSRSSTRSCPAHSSELVFSFLASVHTQSLLAFWVSRSSETIYFPKVSVIYYFFVNFCFASFDICHCMWSLQ